MAKFDVLDINGKKVDTVELSDAVFGIKPNEKVMHMAVVNFLANQRQGTQSTLTRAEVRGGGRKPWKQKGTGRARQGSIRSPQWTHGGIALGPKPRDFSYSLNRKVKKLALVSALSAKAQAGKLIIVNDFAITDYSTKAVIKMLENINV
ncbi:MAG: 50S ribosomal protein L4, partial [Oscillospiraceae bacterium]